MADLGTGTTVTFGSSSFAMELTNVQRSGVSRPAIKTSHMGTSAWDTFTPGNLVDGGEIVLEELWDGDENPPITAAAETVTIAWAGTANTDASSGFLVGFDITAPLEELMTCSVRVKLSGATT